MLHIKKCVTTVLVIMLVVNILRINISAEGEEDFSSEENTTEITEAPSADQPTNENTVAVEEPQENETESQESVGAEDNQITEQEVITVPEEPIQAYTKEESQTVAEGASEANAGDNFATSFRSALKGAGFADDSINVIMGSNNTITISEGQGKVLDLLSQQPQTSDNNYQHYEIKFSSTGNISLSNDYFKGLGSEEFPFKGNFTGSAITIQTTNTIFNALYASSNLNGVQINWQGTADKPIFAKKLIADEYEHEINMPLANAKEFSPYIGQIGGGSGQVTLPYLDYSAVKRYETVDYGNAVGLACGKMLDSTSLQLKSITLPSVPLNLKGTSVGSLIGIMGNNAKLLISENISVDAVLVGENVGGLVGYMTDAVINFVEEKKANVSADLTASKSVGGIAGEMTTSTGILGTNANVILDSVKANGGQNAGILYGACTATGSFNPMTGVVFGNRAVREVSGSGNCGGLFGTLNLLGSGKCTISGTEDDKLAINSTITTATNNTQYGGIAGTLTGVTKSNALVVNYCDITLTNQGADYSKYLGGIVAVQGENCTVDVKNCKTTVQDPKNLNGGYGGICGFVGNDALLIAEKVAIKTDFVNTLIYPSGGGIAGSTNLGSIVYLKTELDLSECALETVAASGQIVGKQDCSLIYAPNNENGDKVSIERLNTTLGFNGQKLTGVELDDIGNYGELYRIQGLIKVSDDGNYTVNYLHTISQTDGSYVLSSALDYACLALAWQSRGYFQTVNGINTTNWSNLKTSTITFNADIDLTGCGIGGLTRDVHSNNDTFSGKVDGMSDEIIHKVTLDIGADNQANTAKVSKGDGRIYWHNATGLFAGLSNDATVQNLTLDGNIRLSNNKISPMSSGAVAAQVSVSQTTRSLLSKVSTAVKYDTKMNGGNTLYLGGLIGQISSGSTSIVFDHGSSLGAIIDISQSGNGSYNHIGGAIGGIAGAASATITCNGATLSGSITSTGTVTNLYAGGLIGTIMPKNNSTRKVNITNLNINVFTLIGNATERMGGVLGGIWADTDVNVDGLNVNNTTLIASGAAALGGLVYRASGKWSVSGIDLSGLTISAQNASTLGLMVCHGEPYKEPVNSTTLNNNVDGLYLEMTEHWDWNDETKKGYNVPSSITFGNGSFDEIVAYTAYRDSSGNYDITHNGSGIVSLKTENGAVNMGNEDSRNTYVNCTTIGQSKQTNLYSRYYYNLDQIVSELNDSNDKTIDTAKELLIWSVCRYADSTLRKYFKTSGISELWKVTTIGGTTDSHADFDMEGLSYYPIDITNSDVTVQYADVKFYNNVIEEKEINIPKNKSTRGTSSNHTQHYMMHCALFLNFTAENISKTTEYKMTLNGVSFAGTVGKVNGVSGALLCGAVKGDSSSGNTATCKVILADDDKSEKAVSLAEILVDSKDEYTPVLINKIDSYAGLTAKYITTTDQQKVILAGSSLIGDVGGEGATDIAVSFSGTIKLPESGVFSKATLLNSIRYNSGSATYNFYKSKDYDSDNYNHNATHGKELSTTVEYFGKQGCYYDGYGEGYFISVNNNFNAQNDFSIILPYVAFSPATSETHTLENGWHEIAVNVLSSDITDGCGTYGHPYKVNGNLLKQAAEYINTGVASNGWQIQISKDDEYHASVSDHDMLLTYKDGAWENGTDTFNEDYVRRYLQSAYYQLVYEKDENGNPKDITLNNFPGIGTNPDWAFKGVITGEQIDGPNANVVITGGSSAFIKYSYGSVVRDVSIQMNQSISLTHVYPTTTNNVTEAKQSPTTFFGGVIGSVLGGDNIIENVIVSGGAGISTNATNEHLIPMGSYVGVINGGGVIFRGTCTNTSTLKESNNEKYLYQNPYIGRVIGGYAFYEGTGTVPNNSNKNYTINKITPTEESGEKDLSWDGNTLTVNNAQGLLILSAIVSSGAGSTSSNAYRNGVARNAAYNAIGEGTKPEDYSNAKADAGAVWKNSNTPYLLNKYASYTGDASICTGTDSGINVLFKRDVIFDMADYCNGYRGLSARYVSNAAFSGSTVTPSAVVMRVKTFDGQNATLQNINMNVKEYADDDFHMASMGGVFNIVWTQKQSGGGGEGSNFAQNLMLKDCNVNLQYVNSNGEDTFCASTEDVTAFDDIEGRSGVSVGGFIGSANDTTNTDISVNEKTSNYSFKNIHITGTNNENRCNIVGPNAAGGLIGTTAMTYNTVTGYPGVLISNSQKAQFAPSLLNCSYKNINVTSQFSAGGMIGHVNARKGTPSFGSLGESATNNENSGWYASFTVTDSNLVIGKNSTIIAEAWGSVAGGIYAATGMRNLFNAPNVDTQTGLAIKGENTIQTLKLESVNVSANTEGRQINTINEGSISRNGNGEMAAGGITARHGSQNPSWYYSISLLNCAISTGKKVSAEYAGGIVGSGYTNQKLVMEQCEIKNSIIDSQNAGGFLGYGYNYTSESIHFNYHLSNSRIEGSTINGTKCAGGLAALSQGKYYLYNILIKNTSVTGGTTGRLLGTVNFKDTNAKTGFELYAAGISVFIDPQNSSLISLPDQDLNQTSYTGYVSYADYAGTETKVTGKQNPYVTVNPNYKLTGTAYESVPDKMLTGDAVGKIQGDTYNSVAARIWADNITGATGIKNLAPYVNSSSIVNTDEKTVPEVSTFREVQGYKKNEEIKENETVTWPFEVDLPVLMIKGNDASAIEDYLNVITNGGYKKANTTPTVSVYYYDKDKGTFSKETDTQKTTNPASIYYENGQFHVRSRSFDNTLDRFSLVEVNFNVTINGEQRTYTVSLPVVVIRELQYDYMATFSYGKEFMSSKYNDIKTHLLESTGNPFTVYLTYQYNRENEEYREYDWQTYMDDGGNMLTIDKVLNFSSGLPTGTQMILIDCQNGNQAYQYTTTNSKTYNVKMSDFISLIDGTKFQSSMADVLGVTRSEPTDSGKFIETVEENATVRLDDIYYRIYNAENDSGSENIERYDLTVPGLKDNAPTENYYLVITVPEQNDDAEYYINGSLTSSLGWTMPSNGTKLHRYTISDNKHEEDNGNNTESTYQISTGYRQELASTAGPGKVDLSASTNKMQVKLKDTITFSNKQVYGDSDQLFLKFTANLKEHKSENEVETSEERQFPVGTSGTVKFYVKEWATKNYYVWDGTSWKSEQVTEEQDLPVAASYLWESNGGNMELLLSTDGQNALDLAAVRQTIKGAKTEGDSSIVVTAEMDVEFGTPVVLEAAIPGSDKAGADIWAQMHYISQISTQEGSIDYSSMRVTTIDDADYYRNVTYQAVLSMDAANIDQLGVNPLQLVEDYQTIIEERNASRIDLNAVLDLSNLQDVENLLKSTSSITFTLSLKRRNGEIYEDVTTTSEEPVYTVFEWDNDYDNTDWSWTISKEEYYANNSVNTSGIFDGTQFSFPITAYVFTDKKNYANYSINLSVSFDGMEQQPSLNDSDAYVVYTYACIKPTFYEFNSGN